MSRGTDHMPYAELTFWGRLWRQVRASANAGVCPNCLTALPDGDYCSEGCFDEHQANNAW